MNEKDSYTLVHWLWAFQYTVPLVIGTAFNIYLGQLMTVMIFGLVFFTGSLLLTCAALSANYLFLLYLALYLIALGSGAIKPAAISSALDNTAPLIKLPRIFRTLHVIIHIVMFLSALWSPILIDVTFFGMGKSFSLSFGLSALLVGCVMALFFLSKHHFPDSKASPEPYLSLFHIVHQRVARFFFPNTKRNISQDSLEGQSENADFVQLVKLFKTLIPISAFWMLYDLQYSGWIEQALSMQNLGLLFLRNIPADIPILSNLIILIAVPIVAILIYPLVHRSWRITSAKSKLVAAIAAASFSHLVAAYVQYEIESRKEKIAFFWQIPQLFLISVSEIVLGMSEMKFLYETCPERLYAVAILLWLMLVGFSNSLLAIFRYIDPVRRILDTGSQIPNYIFFSMLGFLSAIVLYRSEDLKSLSK